MSGDKITKKKAKIELLRCNESPAYFIINYIKIYDPVVGDFIPFSLWPAQFDVIDQLLLHRLLIILKARQEGLTWLILAFALWLMLFKPAATILLFSRRDTEAVHMLVDRLKEMYKRLPKWLQARDILQDNDHEWILSNNSVARAFPTTAGDSYTASMALVDEADLVPDLNRLMRAVKPTIDAGGRMVLLSRSDKSKPESEFKNIYRAARVGENDWHPIFLPWFARPDRDETWYEAQKRDILSRTGSLDDLYEQYPATDAEALSARTLDKRIPPQWLTACYQESFATDHPLSVPGLIIYKLPETGHTYVGGADPAEGNPTSDDSAAIVLDRETGEEVARLRGKIQPAVFASYLDIIGTYYNGAAWMVERNNHGHAVLLWLEDNSSLMILNGHDSKIGWLSSSRGKSLLYDLGADAFRTKDTLIRSFDTFNQLGSVEGATLRAPEGLMEDLADAYVLALAARTSDGVDKVVVSGPDLLLGYRG